MRYISLKYIISVSALLILISCGEGSASSVPVEGEALTMHYAELLSLRQCEGYIYAEIKNPWGSGVLHSYILIDKKAEKPSHLPEGDIIRIPITNSAVYTSVHCSLVDQLGAYESIKGVADLRFIYLDKIQQDCRTGKIRNLGEGLTPDLEAIMDLSPEAILLSPFQNGGSYGKVTKLGIPVVECADYMETSPLGRAEWMRFYGLLYGKSDEADSIFDAVVSQYNDLKAKAAGAGDKPTVFMDLKYGMVWYVPGGNSTVGIMLADAGADYIYKEREESGSVPLDPEVVFDKVIDGKYWLIKYNQNTDKTYEEIAAEYPNYSRLSAFRNKNVYACNLSGVPYYEEVPFHPDILLKDYIKIFHPDLLPDYKPRYFKPVP